MLDRTAAGPISKLRIAAAEQHPAGARDHEMIVFDRPSEETKREGKQSDERRAAQMYSIHHHVYRRQPAPHDAGARR